MVLDRHEQRRRDRWLYGCRGSGLNAFPSGTPTPSLASLASKTLVANLHRVDEDVLDQLPEYLLKTLWNSMKKSERVSVRAFQLFAPYLSAGDIPRQDLKLPLQKAPRYVRDALSPQQQLPISQDRLISYCRHLTNPSMRWVVSLTIDNAYLDIGCVWALGEMENLASLQMSATAADQDTFMFDTMVAQTMARNAQAAGHFPVLRRLTARVMALDNLETSRMLAKLPHLEDVLLFLPAPPPAYLNRGHSFVFSETHWSLHPQQPDTVSHTSHKARLGVTMYGVFQQDRPVQRPRLGRLCRRHDPPEEAKMEVQERDPGSGDRDKALRPQARQKGLDLLNEVLQMQ